MRVVAGSAKNKRLKTKEGRETRPTLERVKEAVFSIISDEITDSSFLDLYAGIGSIAIEALSRGARRAVLIEQDKEALRIIIENINNCGFENISRAYKNDVIRALEILQRKGELFDIIFLDPPYKENISFDTLKKISECKVLKKEGIIISEHGNYEKLPDEIGDFVKYDERDYNKKILSFYRYK
ncbi:MAG: 16S rRNA (guanine(966)-N(2))-methyltransferase RsmD [Fusobacteriales bacterium]|jgi:16S rRNA (guanine(966)-N(2))-methyltransferase RsmD|nr:16S rRNA (guanine(966)-N(2))-methyltransferase RsmD [Fusobacteriales bacterium]